jgi:hypothetical protein
MTNKQDITAMPSRRDLTPGPSPKERGEGHDIWRQPPLSFGEGPGVRSLLLPSDSFLRNEQKRQFEMHQFKIQNSKFKIFSRIPSYIFRPEASGVPAVAAGCIPFFSSFILINSSLT